MQHYRTQDGDVLDAICIKAYGRCDDVMLATLYDANPGLADYGPIYPAGVVIMLPDAVQPAPERERQGVSLWD